MRRRQVLAPITTIKHYVQFSNTTITTGSAVGLVIADSVQAPATATTADVKEGSIIKAVHCEMWVKSKASEGGDTQFSMIIEKVPANQASVTFAQMATLSAYNNKKNILYSTQGVIGDLSTQSIPIIRDWILIPKGKQRFGLSDRLVMTIGVIGVNMQRCGIFTYKEWT